MFFNRMLGMGCSALAAYFAGAALAGQGNPTAATWFAAACYACAAVLQFLYSAPTRRSRTSGNAPVVAGE